MIDYFVILVTWKSVNQGIIRREDEPILRYGLQAMMEVSIILVTVLLISATFGQVVEALAWLATVILCRSFGEGYHAKSFTSCYFISVMVFVLTLLTVRVMLLEVFLPVGMACMMVSIALFILLSFFIKVNKVGQHQRTYFNISKWIQGGYLGILAFMISSWGVNPVVMASILGFLVSQLSVLIKKRGGIRNEAC